MPAKEKGKKTCVRQKILEEQQQWLHRWQQSAAGMAADAILQGEGGKNTQQKGDTISGRGGERHCGCQQGAGGMEQVR